MSRRYIIILSIIALVAIVLVISNKPNSADDAIKERFVVAHPFDLEKIQGISKYRSCMGHSYSGKTVDGVEEPDDRSLKHYIIPNDGVSEVDIFAPFDGEISSVYFDNTRNNAQVWLTPNLESGQKWSFVFFHINLDEGFEDGSSVIAGQKIGKAKINQGGNFDIALKQGSGFFGPVLAPVYEYFSEELLADYSARGASEQDLIIPKLVRDQNPCPIIPGTEGRDAMFPSSIANEGVLQLL